MKLIIKDDTIVTNKDIAVTNKNERSIYYPLMDVLRFLAAIFVMLFHYFSGSLKGNTDILSTLVIYGALGVELFFIISGFVIYNSIKDNWRDYVISRWLRLYPLFWVCATITYALTILLGEPHLSFYKYLTNLFIINNGKVANMIDGSYWTLTIEIMFYFYIALFAYTIGKKRLIYFYILWLAYSYLSFYFSFNEMLISKLSLVRYSPYFVFGGIMAILLERYRSVPNTSSHLFAEFFNREQKMRSLVEIFILGACVYASYYFSQVLNYQAIITEKSNYFGIFTDTSQKIIFYIFIIALLSSVFSFTIKNKKMIMLCQTLGLITYPLYLLHQKIGNIFINKFDTFGHINVVSIITAILIIMISLYIGILDRDWRRYAIPSTKIIFNKSADTILHFIKSILKTKSINKVRKC